MKRGHVKQYEKTTLSNMFSPAKAEDKKFLLELGETIALLAKIDNPEALDLAERLGHHYLTLEKKIQTHDYTRDDQLFK